MANVTKGFDRSGGWRFGGFSDLYTNLYAPEVYNASLLDKVGNPIDKKAASQNVSVPVAAGLLSNGPTSTRDGGGGLSRDGGLAGNGTNFTDAQWATIKDMRDQIDPATGKMVGFGNDYDQAALKTGALGLMGVLSGSPLKLASMLPSLQQSAKAQYDAIASFGGASNTGLLGQGFGTQAWSDAVNENAAARQARQQQSETEKAAIEKAIADETARKAELDAIAANLNNGALGGGGGGGGNYGSWARGDAGGWGGATGGTDGSASFGGDRGTRGGW